VYKEGNLFRVGEEKDRFNFQDYFQISLMTLEEYNRMEGCDKSLEADEVLIFSSGADFGYGEVLLGDTRWLIREELQECSVVRKARNNFFGGEYVLVLPDRDAVKNAAAVYGTAADENRIFRIAYTPRGEEEKIEAFLQSAASILGGKQDFAGIADNREAVSDMEGMYGGLIFIGIFFGMIFLICLLIIMYYKQVTEGFEDQKNFEIMQKVGMSDEEIRHTIKKQILLVFALPLAGAVLHTAVGMKMVIALMAGIGCYDTSIQVICAVSVCAIFAVLYSACYKRTSVTYYRIVKQMG